MGSIVSIAQILLRKEQDKGNEITPLLIGKKLDAVLSMDPDADFDRDAAVEELVRRFSYWVGKDLTLKSTKGHIDWLNAERKKDWRYWGRLQRYLEQGLSSKVVDSLDQSTDGILELLEDPHREGSWDRRGLVVGHVQSGKTSNYSALICKAADAGYKIIIVLAGLHNNLRSQTQIRLEEAFLGYETSLNREPGNPIGVFSQDSDPKIHPHCATTRADDGDFNSAVAGHFSISPEERPWLFVVKKNPSVLDKLLVWIRKRVSDATYPETGHRIVTKLPLLVIDDEADHASVDAGEQSFDANGNPDKKYKPRTINRLIREILYSFSKSAYVGYTATPFANIFIHRAGETKLAGPDLFPRSFIKNISAPCNYVGPARVFGFRSGDNRTDGLPLTRDILDHVSEDGESGWMPPKHKKDHEPLFKGQPTPPPSLQKAINSFVLACAARTCRGQGKKHSSMLVHVTRYTAVQKAVTSQIQKLVKSMQRRLTRRLDHEGLTATLRELWLEDFTTTSAEIEKLDRDAFENQRIPTWEEIEAVLPQVVADIQVKTVNGSAKDVLDYVEHSETGLKVIAVGGDKLARGLTLEGLCVSYFVRTTKMYDTLMQMGRWFGYRPGYIDLCRLYTSKDLIKWFRLITDASEELREEFDQMVAQGVEPEVYGLKVQSHPGLLVTSPLKMRSAKTLKLSYSGSMSQTISFLNDTASLEANLAASNALICSMGLPSKTGPSLKRGDGVDKWPHSFLWEDISAEQVLDFLKAYKTPLGADRANTLVMAEFIEQMNKCGELENWTVALLAEAKDTSKEYQFSPHVSVDRFPYRTATPADGRCTIGVLTDPKDEAIDLDDLCWQAALASTQSQWKPDVARNRVKKPEAPSGLKIRELRGKGISGGAKPSRKGLLLLYPLSLRRENGELAIKNWDKPVMALAVSFPTSESGVKVDYKVDHLLWKEWEGEYGSAD